MHSEFKTIRMDSFKILIQIYYKYFDCKLFTECLIEISKSGLSITKAK